MDPLNVLIAFLSQFPNLAGLSILSLVLYRQNSRMMNFYERMVANLVDDVEHIKNDTKRIKDKLNVTD